MARTVGSSSAKVVKVFGVNNFMEKRELDGLLKHALKTPLMMVGRA